MLLGLETKLRLQTIMEKIPSAPSTHLQELSLTAPLVLKFGYI